MTDYGLRGKRALVTGGASGIGKATALRLAALGAREGDVTGAGGTVGSLRVSRSTPDGSQFVLGNNGTHSWSQSLYKNPPYETLRDFTPLGLAIESPRAIIVPLKRSRSARTGAVGALRGAIRLVSVWMKEDARLAMKKSGRPTGSASRA